MMLDLHVHVRQLSPCRDSSLQLCRGDLTTMARASGEPWVMIIMTESKKIKPKKYCYWLTVYWSSWQQSKSLSTERDEGLNSQWVYYYIMMAPFVCWQCPVWRNVKKNILVVNFKFGKEYSKVVHHVTCLRKTKTTDPWCLIQFTGQIKVCKNCYLIRFAIKRNTCKS